jgi:hypothetical protein
VTDRPDVDVRFCSIKFLFRHKLKPIPISGAGESLEPTTGLEPVTSSLPRTRSTY